MVLPSNQINFIVGKGLFGGLISLFLGLPIWAKEKPADPLHQKLCSRTEGTHNFYHQIGFSSRFSKRLGIIGSFKALNEQPIEIFYWLRAAIPFSKHYLSPVLHNHPNKLALTFQEFIESRSFRLTPMKCLFINERMEGSLFFDSYQS